MDQLQGSILLDKYRVLSKKGEGTFSEVIKAQRISDGVFCAIKRMKQKMHSQQQVNNLREVQALKRLNPHPNIIKLLEVVFDPKKKTLDLVCELMDMNIYEKIRGRKHHLPESLIKSYVYQLCKSLDHMHRNGIFHRDVKPENILIKDDVLKLADFGSCRGVYSKPPFTEYISTRWYRAPECLLTDGYYSAKMDMWSVGCVFFEIMSLYPLFPGSNETDQLAKIHDIMGTPSSAVLSKIRKNSPHYNFSFPQSQGSGLAKLLPHASAECLQLLNGLLIYDPDLRFSARQALKHPYFKELRDADKRKAKMAHASHRPSPGTKVSRRSRPGRTKENSHSHSHQSKPHKTHGYRSHAKAKGGYSSKAAAASQQPKVQGHSTSMVQLNPVHIKGHHVDRSGHKRRHKKKQVTVPAAKQIVEVVPSLPSIMYKSPKASGGGGHSPHPQGQRTYLPSIASNAGSNPS